MTRTNTSRTLAVTPRMEEAWQAVDACFGRFCLTADIEALRAMMAADVEELCGREALARRLDGSAMGGGRHVGGEGWLPEIESLPSAPLRRALAEHQPRRYETPE
jgi:hypothetical protein